MHFIPFIPVCEIGFTIFNRNETKVPAEVDETVRERWMTVTHFPKKATLIICKVDFFQISVSHIRIIPYHEETNK